MVKKKETRGRPRKDNIRKHVVFDPALFERLEKEMVAERREISSMMHVIIQEYFARLDADASPPP